MCTRRAQWQREAAFVADHNAKSSDLVQLNIGGERFVTVPRSTLTEGDSMLTAMFSGRHTLKTDEQVCVCVRACACTRECAYACVEVGWLVGWGGGGGGGGGGVGDGGTVLTFIYKNADVA